MTASNTGESILRYMPAMRMRCDTSRRKLKMRKVATDQQNALALRTRGLEMMQAFNACRDIASWRSLHIQPCANSTSIMPTSRRLASTSVARSCASSSGKHSAIFAWAIWRRGEGMRTTSAPSRRPSQCRPVAAAVR